MIATPFSRLMTQTARYRGQRSAWQVVLLPQHPRFPLRSAFDLQTARYHGQRGAWQVGVGALTPPLSAALGSPCGRRATAGNEVLAILRAHLRNRVAKMPSRHFFRVGVRMR
jgi:hypothetical protein